MEAWTTLGGPRLSSSTVDSQDFGEAPLKPRWASSSWDSVLGVGVGPASEGPMDAEASVRPVHE